ncbi:ATP-binding cassette domain-containing protein [Vibrio chagasii]|uniref:ATP-binding cassette domain-containing protein n=1 Tax=Vibrio chagasii TaxID=170679 RepID=UPI0013E31A2F
MLQDKSFVNISLKPGINIISGANGSGKSTLLNSLSGFSEIISSENNKEVIKFRELTRGAVRVVTKDPAIYPEFKCLAQQITLSTDEKNPDFNGVSHIISQEILQEWRSKLISLSERFGEREQFSLSSGELIQLSLFRALYNWNDQTNVLMLDECESWLDRGTRKLFLKTIREMSGKVTILFVSHTFKDTPTQSVNTNVNLLAFNKNSQGYLLNMSVTAFTNGDSRVETSGPIANSFVQTFIITKRALIHCYPELSLLEECGFTLSCREDKNIHIVEAGSSGLAFAIALVNLVREFQGLPEKSLHGAAASGHVLLDGTVQQVSGLDIKRKVALENEIEHLFIPLDINHLSKIKAIIS